MKFKNDINTLLYFCTRLHFQTRVAIDMTNFYSKSLQYKIDY